MVCCWWCAQSGVFDSQQREWGGEGPTSKADAAWQDFNAERLEVGPLMTTA